MTPHHSGKAAFTVTRWLWVDGSAHESGAKNPKTTNILCDEDTESQMWKVDEGWETANDAEITDVQKAAKNTNSPKSSCLASTRRFTKFVRFLDPGCAQAGINTAWLNSGVLFHYHQIRPEPNRLSLTLKAQVYGGHAVSAPVSRNTVEAAWWQYMMKE